VDNGKNHGRCIHEHLIIAFTIFFLLAPVLLSGCSQTYSESEAESSETPLPTPLLQGTPQPPLPPIPPSFQEVRGEKREEAIKLALADPEVERWLKKGYEIYGVYAEDGSNMMVYFLTKERKLPWVLGITIGVPVDLFRKEAQGCCINFYLRLASLTEDQKAKVLEIAFKDPEVLRLTEGKEYRIEDVFVGSWESCCKKCTFHAYPAVRINVNPPNVSGVIATVYVDLENETVFKIMRYPRKAYPPPILEG
jgi:hypothetical protein